MIRILEQYNPEVIYQKIYKLIQNLSQEDESIDNIHSVDTNDSRDGYLNVTFDYNDESIVQINITPDGEIEIVAPNDDVKDYIASAITDLYPQYKSLI